MPLLRIFILTLIYLLLGTVQASEMNIPLKQCPDKPNCVLSTSKDERHAIAPIVVASSMEYAKQVVNLVIKSMPRSHILKIEERYVHVSFTSLLFRFVDDVEFWFDVKNKLVHIRSASRSGYSDFGVNRKRVEKIRQLFNETVNQKKAGYLPG